MAKEGQFDLDSITGALAEVGRRLPPVELWDPPFCGNLDMRIAADGTWYYLKTPIGWSRRLRNAASKSRTRRLSPSS